MDLITDEVQLILTYVDAVNAAGARLSRVDLTEFVMNPRPIGAKRSAPWVRTMASALEGFWGEETSPGESTVDFLTRVRWLDSGDDTTTITALGKAVLAHAERPPRLDPTDEPLSVTIDPDDPLAYARIFHLVSTHGPGLLVDPYLKFEGLADLIEISSVNRVLTGSDSAKNRLSIFGRMLGATAGAPVMRLLDRAELHDRFFIPDDGPVYSLGSSLNSIAKRPGVVTPIADAAAGAAIRSAYDALWGRATAVEATTDKTPQRELAARETS